MLGRSRHWRRSTGAPSRASARRMISTVSAVVRRLRGCGEKITASRHLMANSPTPGGVSSGFVVGTSDAMTPDRLRVLHDPPLRQLLDDADASLAQHVAQDAHDLEPLADATLGIADAALLDTHGGEAGECRLVGDRPGDGLAEPVDLLLCRALELRAGPSRARAIRSSTSAVSSGVMGRGAIGLPPSLRTPRPGVRSIRSGTNRDSHPT